MAEVTLRSGDPEVIDYTPSGGNVAAGEVVILDNLTGINCGIAMVDITNNTLGALSVRGGQWDGVNLNNAANYKTVYWDNSVNKFTTVSTNNAKFGYIVSSGGGGANTTCRAMHDPFRGTGE